MKFLKIFFIYSILGHLMETIIAGFWPGKSGFLYGFWTPIYGFGVLFILFCSFLIQKKFKKYSWKYYLILFFSTFIILTLLELLGGILLNSLFHEELWNYSDMPFHIGPYICLPISLIWGFGSIILVKWIQPFFENFLIYIPNWISIIFLVLFFVDNVWTFVTKI